jgi:hypothetical protein
MKSLTWVRNIISGRESFYLGIKLHSWGRCYDHNFLRFSTIFGKKIGVFLKKQCYDQNFALFSFVLSKKRHFFAEFFGKNILKIIASVPGCKTCFSGFCPSEAELQEILHDMEDPQANGYIHIDRFYPMMSKILTEQK